VFDSRFQSVREKVIGLIADGKAASMAIAVAKDGNILWEEAFGYSELEKKIPATPHTRYGSGSIAKTITATGLMTLVEKGLVDLDKPVLEYAPHVRLRSFVGDEKEITVRHILNHRSGMPSYCESFFEDDPGGFRDILETLRHYGIFTYRPGQYFIYSNLGYMLIAYLISEVSGMDFPRYIEENVFQPLKMDDAKVKGRGRAADRFAVCYTPDFKRIPDYRTSFPGASDFSFSAHDLIRFAMFHLKDHHPDQKAIVSDETIDEMQKDFPPSNTRYGIGWDFDVNEAGYRSVYHGGEDPGIDNFMRLIPSKDMAVVILCNNDIGDRLGDLQEEICALLIPNFSKIGRDQSGTDRSVTDSGKQELPEGFLGRWEGKIISGSLEIRVVMRVAEGDGIYVGLSKCREEEFDLSVATDGFLMGDFAGTIPSPGTGRHPERIRLSLVRQGDRITGQATVVGREEERQRHYELSSWIELRKM